MKNQLKVACLILLSMNSCNAQNNCDGDTIIELPKTTQQNNSLFNISNEEVSSKFREILEEDSLSLFQLKNKYISFDIELDSMGNILSIECTDNITGFNYLSEKYSLALAELAPFNPIYYVEEKKFKDFMDLYIIFKDTVITVEY